MAERASLDDIRADGNDIVLDEDLCKPSTWPTRSALREDHGERFARRSRPRCAPPAPTTARCTSARRSSRGELFPEPLCDDRVWLRPPGLDVGETGSHGGDELRSLHQIVVRGRRQHDARGSSVLGDDERLSRVTNALQEVGGLGLELADANEILGHTNALLHVPRIDRIRSDTRFAGGGRSPHDARPLRSASAHLARARVDRSPEHPRLLRDDRATLARAACADARTSPNRGGEVCVARRPVELDSSCNRDETRRASGGFGCPKLW